MYIVVSEEKISLPEIVKKMQARNVMRGIARENVYRHLEILVNAGLIGKQYDQNQKKIYYLPKVKSIKIEFGREGLKIDIEAMDVD
jgi:Fe2+ or Zn2+ uptake regulation protein